MPKPSSFRAVRVASTAASNASGRRTSKASSSVICHLSWYPPLAGGPPPRRHAPRWRATPPDGGSSLRVGFPGRIEQLRIVRDRGRDHLLRMDPVVWLAHRDLVVAESLALVGREVVNQPVNQDTGHLVQFGDLSVHGIVAK